MVSRGSASLGIATRPIFGVPREFRGLFSSMYFFVSQPSAVNVTVNQLNQLLGSHYRGAPQGTQFLKPANAYRLGSLLFQSSGDIAVLGDGVVDQVVIDRGGNQPPVVSDYVIGSKPAYGSSVGKEFGDPEIRRQAHKRRNESHRVTLDAVAGAAKSAHLDYKKTQYADLVILPSASENATLIEVKSLESDDVKQTRAALAQLYFYKFIHAELYPHTQLAAVFSRRPVHSTHSLIEFLEECGIAVAWLEGDQFIGGSGRFSAVSWMCTKSS